MTQAAAAREPFTAMHESPPVNRPRPRRPSLYVQVLVAIALGVAVGALRPALGIELRPLGDGFVKIIKMLIGPLVFTTVTIGIAGAGDAKKAGRVGAKALVWFEFMSTFALLLGLAMVHLVKPGMGLHATAASLDASSIQRELAAPRPHGLASHLLAIIPDSVGSAFVSGDVLQILFLAVLAGAALGGLGERGRPLIAFLEQVVSAIFAVIGLVMRAAPVGAFGAMAFTIGKFGIGTLGSLARLMGTFYATAFLFVFVILGAVMRLAGLSIVRLVVYLREELVIVLGTSSSESALPRIMAKLEALGCQPEIVRLVIPTGYSFNLDGTSIYLTMASVFVAQALDVTLTPGQEMTLLLVLLLTSKGAAGVTGSGFVTLAATLASTGTVPVAGLTLLLGIDRFMSEARALTNIVGNAVATIVVARWEGALDMSVARVALAPNRNAPAPATAATRDASQSPP